MTFAELHEMDPYDFEIFSGQLFSALGYNVLLTAATADGGVDLILDKFDPNLRNWIRNVIQVKRYKSNIGIDKIRELNGVLKIHNSPFGSLITLSNFKKGVNEKTHKDFSNITLIPGNEFKKLLKKAGLMDSEENIIFSSHPNLENNRRYTIMKILKENRPKGIKKENVISILNNDFSVTVKKEKIEYDISSLEETGQIIDVSGIIHYSPKQSEIQFAIKGIPDLIPSIDYFLNEKTLCRILEDNYKINRNIVKKYFRKEINSLINDLVNSGNLYPISDGLYASPLAIEKFRSSKISVDEIKENIEAILDFETNGENKLIRDTDFYPEKGNVHLVSGTDEESKKLLPFFAIVFFRCPDCNSLHVQIDERISALITSSEIQRRFEQNRENEDYQGAIEEVAKCFSMSRIFV